MRKFLNKRISLKLFIFVRKKTEYAFKVKDFFVKEFKLSFKISNFNCQTLNHLSQLKNRALSRPLFNMYMIDRYLNILKSDTQQNI